MSSTKIQLQWQPLPRVPARNHRMINSVVFGVPIKSHHRVSDVLSRMSGPSFGSVTSVSVRTNARPFLRGDGNGRFGRFGGKFVPETLMSRLRDLEEELDFVLSDHEFQSRTTGDGPEIYLKREDLGHSGSHKMNNALAQAMIARRLGCSRVVAATGAGQHGVATAAACAKLCLECTVSSLEGTFQDASSEAIRNWVENLETTYYLSGTVVGPHPSPVMVREFQSVIGKETRRQAKRLWGGKPDVLVACVGSGSNALGLFHEFVGDEDVRLVGVEAAGLGLDSGKHSATLAVGDVGVYHGSMSYLLQDDQGQILRPHSIGVGGLYVKYSEPHICLIGRGLEYPGVGPEISFLKETGRVEFYTATDKEAIQACMLLSRLEGIIPALEASHALAFLDKLVPILHDGAKVIVNCSGRGDKDIDTLIQRGMSHYT
ncbi:hypothetical protein BRARA_H02705 [Brassica rapa]|uniref:tryptophan synthase n=1 Tax=Brassica campestris TaxID=3711 RepID=A0A397YF35_BRACM|nr:hypothetical protein BRARA_H02705 [Brassica rapa]